MTHDDRRRAAQAILEFPFFLDLWAELEAAAVNAAIYADYADHEKRQGAAMQARAYREILSRIRSVANSGQTDDVRRKAPA